MKKAGVSLMELIIVIAVIAILAMLAIPSFNRFLAKSKRAEAYMNLRSLFTAEKTYWAEHGRYTDVLSGENGLGWKPEGYRGGGKQENFYYTYGFPGAEGKNHFTGNLETSASGLSGAHAHAHGFTIYAVGDIDGDGKPDILSIDERGTISVIHDDIAQ